MNYSFRLQTDRKTLPYHYSYDDWFAEPGDSLGSGSQVMPIHMLDDIVSGKGDDHGEYEGNTILLVHGEITDSGGTYDIVLPSDVKAVAAFKLSEVEEILEQVNRDSETAFTILLEQASWEKPAFVETMTGVPKEFALCDIQINYRYDEEGILEIIWICDDEEYTLDQFSAMRTSNLEDAAKNQTQVGEH